MTGWGCSSERGVGTACPSCPRAKQSKERERERLADSLARAEEERETHTHTHTQRARIISLYGLKQVSKSQDSNM